jgi:hypothetical protein
MNWIMPDNTGVVQKNHQWFVKMGDKLVEFSEDMQIPWEQSDN